MKKMFSLTSPFPFRGGGGALIFIYLFALDFESSVHVRVSRKLLRM